jgi:methyl-accepting chemotaxis protein
MRNLNFAPKAIIISLVFLLPVLLLGYFFYTGQKDQIDFSAKERLGVTAFREFVPVYTGVLKTRNATRAALGGFDGKARYQAAREQTDAALKALDNYIASSGDPLSLRADFNKLQEAWAATAQSTNGADAQGRTVFGPVTASLVKLLGGIGDNSNLVLDPDVDSYYIISMMLLGMPQAAEDLGQLWGWGTFGLVRFQQTQKEFTPKEIVRYAVWAANVESSLKQFRGYLDKAIAYNPSVKSRLDLAVLDEVGAFYEAAKDPEALLKRENLTPAQFYEKGESAVVRLQAFYDKGVPVLDELLDVRISAMQQRLNLAAIVVGAVLLFGAYFFYSFFLVTRGGLELISKHLKQIAEGDLRTAPAMPLGSDEPSLVIYDLRTAYESLHMLIRQVRHSARALHAASSEISDAATDLSSRTELAASTLGEQASAMAQISETVSATANQAKMAATFAVDNAGVAERGGQVFTEVVATMRDIHDSSNKINDIISVIDGIAFQTNILALNAAVEAARAGESGRGFAVVAAEVRNLAGRSASAAREIKSLITVSVDKVRAGTQVVEGAGTTMTAVVTNARQINQFLSDISDAARAQAGDVDKVGQAIQQLDTNTQQNAALVEETMAAAGALRHQADTLQEEIANFKVS